MSPASAGAAIAVTSPMGAGLDDLDGDGRLDLVVTLGVADQAVLQGMGDGTFAQVTGAGEHVAFDAPDRRIEFPWSVAFPDVDMDGRGDVLWTIGDDATSFLGLDGHLMRNRLLRNEGDLRLVDVDLGLTAEGSYRALALADPDRDGDADVAIGGFGGDSRLWRNDVDTGASGISLRLRGTTSNALGLGATVVAQVAGLPDRTASMGGLGNPDGTSEPILFFGAGTTGVVDRLQITWPSGFVQHVDGLVAGRMHTVEEPPTLEVLDGDRHAPADGASEVVLRVTPRAPDGSVRMAASVQVRLAGAGSLIDVTPQTDGTWLARVRAPTGQGVARFLVSVDGIDSGCMPRVWWDRVP